MAQVVRKEQCRECAAVGADNSGDNKIVYDDESAFCFRCWEQKGDKMSTTETVRIVGEILAIPERKLYLDTCQKFGVEQTKDKWLFNLFEQGDVVAQKFRSKVDKASQGWIFGGKNNGLFGMGTCNPSNKVPIVITEGEFDAMSITQETGLPAVSITKGANSAKTQCSENLTWLQSWKYVILALDMDEPGRKAANECVPLFEIGQVKIARFPRKDANDMLMSGQGSDIKQFLWDAEVVRPNSILTPKSVLNAVLERPTKGYDWPWPSLNTFTCGFYPGEMYVIVAAPGIGKTEFCREIIYKLILQDVKVGVFSLEQEVSETVKRLVGGKLNRRLHVPTDGDWDDGEITKEVNYLEDKLFLYNTGRGVLTLEQLLINIRYMVKAFGVKLIVIDNLKALCAFPTVDGKRVQESEYVGVIVSKLFTIRKELDVGIIIISHVAKNHIQKSMSISLKSEELSDDEEDSSAHTRGSSWACGRRPDMDDILGSTTVGALVDYVIGLSRHTMSDNFLDRATTYVQMLKTRRASEHNGKTFKLRYDYDLGKLNEV